MIGLARPSGVDTCRRLAVGMGSMCVHFSGMVDVPIYDLGGKVELSPAEENILDQFAGARTCLSQNLVNRQRM